MLTNISNPRCRLMTAPSLTPMCARAPSLLAKQASMRARSALQEQGKRHPQEGQHSADAIAAGPGTECSRETG